jgi:uncharacterized protein YbjT (DUF2867 family)
MGIGARRWLIGAGIVLAIGAAVVLLSIPPGAATGLSSDNARAASALTGKAAAPPLRVLVIGGTKGVGRAVVDLAAARGHVVTAMARSAPEQPFESASVAFAQGDVTDAEAVKKAAADQDAVVLSISTRPTREPVTVYSEGTRNILQARNAGQPLRVICVTGIGAGDSRGHGGVFYDRVLQPLMLRTAYEDKDRAEEMLHGSDALWTIVRPGFLTDDAETGRYLVVTQMDGVRSGSISRRDVAHFIVSVLEDPAASSQTVLLTH